jgi:hypothetical protein
MYLRYMTTSPRDALVRSLRDHAGTEAALKAEAAAWLRSRVEWEHRFSEIEGHPLPCDEQPPVRRRGVA